MLLVCPFAHNPLVRFSDDPEMHRKPGCDNSLRTPPPFIVINILWTLIDPDANI
jgi:hypothetical protein